MRATFDATGEVLLATGAASGIGAAAVAAYVAAGGSAVVLDIAATPGEPLPPRVQHVRCDVSDRDAVTAAAAGVIQRHGRIDALLAGAAVQPRVAVADMPAEQWRHTLAVNLDGVVWACQAVLPGMTASRRGSIVVFGSGLGATGHPQASAYAASKAALLAYAKSLAAEVAEHRVRVNTLFPGVIDTPQFRAANPPGGEQERWSQTIGIGQPADVVGPLLFLFSDQATMTGSILTRDRAYPAADQGDDA